MLVKPHVTCFASEDPIAQQVARFRCPYEHPQKFSICWLVSIYLVAPSFSTAMFSWMLHCKKKKYVCRLISSYLHHLFYLDSTDKCQWFSVWKLNEWYKEKCRSRYSRCLCHWFYHIKSERNGILTYS